MLRMDRWRWAAMVAIAIMTLIALLKYRSPTVTSPVFVPPVSKIASTKADTGTSKFHLLLAASNQHPRLCRAILSSALLGYPVSVLSGWGKTDGLDAGISHLAKVRNVMRYLDTLPPSSDQDLVLMVDGYDVVFQLPADVLIQRYFAVTAAADAALATRFGEDYLRATPEESRPRATVLFGPEKLCYPPNEARSGCWAVPTNTGLAPDAYGPDDGSIEHMLNRWLNSGTVIGPVRDMKKVFNGTLKRIQDFYNPEDDWSKDSDQKYMSDLWGDQEYFRSVKELQLNNHTGTVLPGVGSTKAVPTRELGQETEYHIGIDYKGELFQTRAVFEHALDLVPFNNTDSQGALSSWVTRNVTDHTDFKPYSVPLPANVILSLKRLLMSISQTLKAKPADMVPQLPLNMNVVTRKVHAIFHCTGPKEYLDDLWPKMWFYPYLRSLLDVAIRSQRTGRRISDTPIDGRKWISAHPPSTNAGNNDVNALGAWADLEGEWLEWGPLCGQYNHEIFGDQ